MGKVSNRPQAPEPGQREQTPRDCGRGTDSRGYPHFEYQVARGDVPTYPARAERADPSRPIDHWYSRPGANPKTVTAPVMLVTMTEYAQARAAHRAYRRALLPTRTPRGESQRRMDPQTVTALRRRVKAADARVSALRQGWERSSGDVTNKASI